MSKQKIMKEREDLNSTVNHLDLIDSLEHYTQQQKNIHAFKE